MLSLAVMVTTSTKLIPGGGYDIRLRDRRIYSASDFDVLGTCDTFF